MITSPIAIGWCRRRHGTRPRDDEHEQGQCEALVAVRLIRRALLRAGSSPRRPDEQRDPEQHECEVNHLHPLPRHTVQVRRFLVGVARSVLVRERVVDFGIPNLALVQARAVVATQRTAFHDRVEFGCETSQFVTSFVRLPGSYFRL